MADMDFSQTLPAIDQNLTGVWTQQDKDLYAKYPFFLVKAEEEMRKRYLTWQNLITDTVPWQANMAEVMRQVIVERSPILFQEFRPLAIQQDPLADIHNVRERQVEARIYSHEFYSTHFHFLPSFQDYFGGHLIPSRMNIEEQIRYRLEAFYRTYIWDYSPYVYFVGKAGASRVVAPTGPGAKTPEWIAEQLALANGNNTLSFKELYKAVNVFVDESGATPYQGSGQPGGDSKPLDERYCFVTSRRQWLQFIDDPWLKENRPINMNIVTQGFEGDIFGMLRCKIERYPFRWAVNNNNIPSYPAPETILLDPNSPDNNRTVPSLAYARSDQTQVEVGWLVGGKNYRRIKIGPPPEFFSGSNSDPSKIAGMNWNGLVYATRNFLIPKKNAANELWYDTNAMGRYIRFQALLAMGIIHTHAFNIMPVVYRTHANLSTVEDGTASVA